MSRVTPLLLAALALVAGCGTGPRLVNLPPCPHCIAAATADRSVPRCPLGHDELKRVPVLYGEHYWRPVKLAGPEARDPAPITYVWGGLSVAPDSPTDTIVCMRCGAVQGTKFGVWSRQSMNREEFTLIPLIGELPTEAPGAVVSKRSYAQHIRADAHQEEFSFETTEPLASLVSRLERYWQASSMTIRESSPPLDMRGIAIDATWHEHDVQSEIIDLPDGRARMVRLSVSRGNVWPSP